MEYTEIENRVSLYEEYIMLGLRMVKGISIEYIKQHFDIDILIEREKYISKYQSMGFLRVKDGYISATDSGMKVLNQIILDLS